MYRRNLALIFLVVIAAAVCVIMSCDRGSKKESLARIIWIADPNPIRKEQIAIAEKQNPDFKIELDWSNTGLQKLLTQIAGSVPPDISMIYSFEDFVILCEKEVLEDLTPYCKKYNVDMGDFWPGLKPFIYYKGRVYGFPEVTSTFVLFYNKKLFNEGGVPYPEEGWSWAEFISAAQKLTKKDTTGKIIQYGFVSDDIRINLVNQYDAHFYSEDGKVCTVDSPEFIEAMRFLYDLPFKYHVMPRPSEWQSIQRVSGIDFVAGILGSGKAAMLIGNRYHTISLRQLKDIDWDIALLPRGKHKRTSLNAHTNIIPRNSKNKDAAFRFLISLISKESGMLVANYGEAVPSLRSVALSEDFLFNPAFPKEIKNSIYLEGLKYAEAMSEYSPYVSPIEVKRIMEEEESKLWAEKESVEETYRNVAKRVNKLIEINLVQTK